MVAIDPRGFRMKWQKQVMNYGFSWELPSKINVCVCECMSLHIPISLSVNRLIHRSTHTEALQNYKKGIHVHSKHWQHQQCEVLSFTKRSTVQFNCLHVHPFGKSFARQKSTRTLCIPPWCFCKVCGVSTTVTQHSEKENPLFHCRRHHLDPHYGWSGGGCDLERNQCAAAVSGSQVAVHHESRDDVFSWSAAEL